MNSYTAELEFYWEFQLISVTELVDRRDYVWGGVKGGGAGSYLDNLHLLLPRANALLQPPVRLLGPQVLLHAGRLVVRDLAPQTLVEGLLFAALLGGGHEWR